MGRKKCEGWSMVSFGLEFDNAGGISLSKSVGKCDDITRKFCEANGLAGKPVVTAPFRCIVAFSGDPDPGLEDSVKMIFSEHLEKCEHAFHLDGIPFKSPILVPEYPRPACPFNPLEPFVRPTKPGDWPPSSSPGDWPPSSSPGDWPPSPSPGDFSWDDGKHRHVVTDAGIKTTEDSKCDQGDKS